MKRLMELLGLDIPKWDGPTVCESATATSQSSDDVKPGRGRAAEEELKRDVIKEERKREAEQLTQDDGVKEEPVSVKRERGESPVEEK